MKTQALYDQGSARIPEDGMIFNPPFFYGVTDGISGLYLPHEGPRIFSGRTGGQFASHAISLAFESASFGESIKTILQKANAMIWRMCQLKELLIKETESLPSAAFAVASIDDKGVEILQAADCLAVWQMKDGSIGGTPNLAFAYEERLLSTIARLMKKHRGNRQKMWEEFHPITTKERRANINTPQGGFALLNGQPESEDYWQKFTLERAGVELLILFSDGLVPFEWTRDEKEMGEQVITIYRQGGLHSALNATRAIAEQKKSSSHEDYAEATAVAIEF